MHKLVEREAFSHSAKIQGTELKNNFLLKVFMAFCVSLVKGIRKTERGKGTERNLKLSFK